MTFAFEVKFQFRAPIASAPPNKMTFGICARTIWRYATLWRLRGRK